MNQEQRGARLPRDNDKVELLVDFPDYGIKKGEIGTILVVYDTYDMFNEGNDFEVFFESIDTSLILLESQFKLL